MMVYEARLSDQSLVVLQETLLRWAAEANTERRAAAGVVFSLKALELACILLERQGDFEQAEYGRSHLAIVRARFTELTGERC